MSEAFISALTKLAAAEDRAALAALRHGLGRPPGTVSSMHPYVVPFLGRDASPVNERAHYVVAALFAMHPQPGGAGTGLGSALSRVAQETGSGSVEARFVALLESHPDDLSEHLRHAVSLVRAKEIALDWGRLLQDLLAWDHPERWVQRRWARDFWARRAQTEDDPSQEAEVKE